MKSIRDLLQTPRRAPEERFSQEIVDESTPELEIAPPASPVPPSFPTQRETPPKSHRIFFTTGATSAATTNPAAGEIQTEFGINSIKASNLTSQWVYLVDVDEFIPPQTWNAVIRGNGSARLRAIFETPPGMTAGSIQSANERCMILVTQELLPISPGMPARTTPTT